MTITQEKLVSADDTERDLRGAVDPRRKDGLPQTDGSVLVRPTAAAHLSDEQVRELGDELDALRDEIISSRGARDAAYIHRMITIQRSLEIGGRLALLFAKYKPALALGTGMVAVGKILDNMEIGHNVLHGQWDWMRDPDIHSTTYEWDFVAPARGWQHTHNDIHHTWTNVIGKDRDVGYNILRVSEDQPWRERDRWNPLVNLALAFVFDWGIAHYDLEIDMVQAGYKPKEQYEAEKKLLYAKARKQYTKEFVAFPLIATVVSRSGRAALLGSVGASVIRNVWAHSVIFCGHFPEGAETFSEEMVEGETRGDWYIRQMLGSANLSGSKLFHIMTGNLSHQIEHHLFPDAPSNRLMEIAPRVRDLCDRYGLPYTTGPLPKQLYSTWKRITELSVPDDWTPPWRRGRFAHA